MELNVKNYLHAYNVMTFLKDEIYLNNEESRKIIIEEMKLRFNIDVKNIYKYRSPGIYITEVDYSN